MDKLRKLLNRHAISFKVESNLAGNFVKSTTSATYYNVANEIANELNAIKRGQESSNAETSALPLHIVSKRLLFAAYLQGKRDQIYWPTKWEDYESIGRYRVMKQFLKWYSTVC